MTGTRQHPSTQPEPPPSGGAAPSSGITANPRTRRATRMLDVAERAGVALSTVSAFMNGSAPVGPDAAERIREAIKELNYSPNTTARSLARGAAEAEPIFLVLRSHPKGEIAAEAYRSETEARAAAARGVGDQPHLISAMLDGQRSPRADRERDTVARRHQRNGALRRMRTTMRDAALDAFREHMDRFDWSKQTNSRRKILQAFLRLAIQHGFNAVSMRMIANEVDVKAPSLYAHFPNGRDEIVAESLRWHFYRFGVALLGAVEDTQTAEEYWDSMVKLHFTRQVSLPESNLWDLLVAADSMLHFLASDLRGEVDLWVSLHENMYVSAAADMGCKDPEAPVRVVMALLESSTRWIPISPTPETDLEPLADRAAALSKALLQLPI